MTHLAAFESKNEKLTLPMLKLNALACRSTAATLFFHSETVSPSESRSHPAINYAFQYLAQVK